MANKIHEIENGKLYVHDSGAYVSVRNDERFFTMYSKDDKPIGTLMRPRIGQRPSLWEVFDLDGARLVARFTSYVTFVRAVTLLVERKAL